MPSPPPTPLPARVHCNRGFGAWFWVVIAAIALLAPVTTANAAQSNASPVPGLVICLVVAVLFFLARVFLLPRLEFLPAQGASAPGGAPFPTPGSQPSTSAENAGQQGSGHASSPTTAPR